MPRKSPTVENRVYLFRDLASAWLSEHGGLLVSDREAALAALADIAFVSCVLADTEDESADAVASRMRPGPAPDS